MLTRRLKNILSAKLSARYPKLADRFVASYIPEASNDVPWTPVIKEPAFSKIALVTTAGVHHKNQKPFDMNDPNGDPSFRIIDPLTISSDYRITHDYYDHKDADRDLNIVLPIDRLRQLEADGMIAGISKRHFSFMGHITGPHIPYLMETTAARAAQMLIHDRVDVVLLTPG